MAALLHRRLVFVTGKGGVGKTTVACALAVLAAGRGRRTLLCEMDASGAVAANLGCPALEYVPREVLPQLSAMSMDAGAEIREYLSVYSPVPLMGRIGPVARVFDFLAAAAPGVRELLAMGKLADEAVSQYELVVVDSAASGHIVGMLASPQAVNDLVAVGPIRAQTARVAAFLADPERTGLVAVTTPAEMPVGETLELAGRLAAETAVELTAVVANRMSAEPFGPADEQCLDWLAGPPVAAALGRLAGGAVSPVLRAATLAVALQRTEAGHIERLRAGLDPSVPIVQLPFVFTAGPGLTMSHSLAELLAEAF